MRACALAGARGSLPEAFPDARPSRRSFCEACGPPWRSFWRAPPPSGFYKPFTSQRALREVSSPEPGE
eukprot:6465549-Pyramimonas_sp.AAC.1